MFMYIRRISGVSLHSLQIMVRGPARGRGPLFLRNGEIRRYLPTKNPPIDYTLVYVMHEFITIYTTKRIG